MLPVKRIANWYFVLTTAKSVRNTKLSRYIIPSSIFLLALKYGNLHQKGPFYLDGIVRERRNLLDLNECEAIEMFWHPLKICETAVAFRIIRICKCKTFVVCGCIEKFICSTLPRVVKLERTPSDWKRSCHLWRSTGLPLQDSRGGTKLT